MLSKETKEEIEQEVSRLFSETQSFVNIDNLARVLAKAIEVFGNSDKAVDWIHFPIPALNNHTPLSMLNTEEEVEQVLTVLGRIDYGVW